MATISSGDLALLRGKNHRTNFYLTPCPARALWSARVNGSLDRGETAVTFDGGSGANFAAIGAYQELWVGSAAGLHDVGRIRIRSISSGDSGVSGTVTIAANSIVTSDNDYLTFIGWYLLKPVRPLIGNDGTFYKDTDITYFNQNSQPNPVCIAGENRAGFIDATLGYFEIESQLASSYAIASGASISSYGAALVWGAASPTISVNSSTGVGTIRFSTAGVYWIKYTVTDSNGKSQDTYRWYYAHSPVINNANYPITDFSINNLSGDYENGGWSCGIQLHNDAALTDIPDYAPCIVWSENWYDETKKNITYLPDESGTIINGYVRRDQFNSDLETGSHTASFELTTIQGVNENKYNFSVSLEAAQTVDAWWKYPSWLTPTRAVHHFFKWHSTLLEVADLIGLNSNTDGIAYAEFQDGTLFGMANGLIRDRSIRASLVCDIGGRLHVIEDTQLRPDSERAALATVQEITNADKSGEIVFVREQENRTPFVHTSGFSFGATFDSDGKPEANAICAIAPGDNPLEDGQSPVSYGKQTFTGQTHANLIAGRILAAENNKLPEVRINLSGNYLGTLGIHLSEFWELTIASGDTVRGIAETHNLILQNVVASPDVRQGTIAITATFEAEATGQTGIATNCPTFPDLPGDDFTIPEIDDLSGALVTAASVNYLPPQTKSWTVHTSEATQHMLSDPFWTTRQDSFASKDAILLRCGVGFIKRSTNGGETWSSITPSTNPPNDAGDSPAPTNTGITYIQGEASYINQSEFVFIARWQNASNEWRSWLVYTANDGTDWTWASLGGGGGNATIPTYAALSTKINANFPVMLNMGNNRLIVGFVSTGNDSVFALIDTNDGTILDLENSSTTSAFLAMCKLTSTRFAIIEESQDANFIFTTVYELESDALVAKANANIYTSLTAFPTAASMARLSDTSWIMAFNVDSSSADNGTAIAVSYNGTDTITPGTAVTFNAGTTPYLVLLEGSVGTHCYYQDDSLTDIRAVMLTTTGTAITVNSSIQISSSSVKYIGAAIMSGDKAIVAFADSADSDNLWARAITLGTSSATMGLSKELKNAAVTAVYVTPSGVDSGYVAYRHGTNTLSYVDFSVSGHTITVGSETNFAFSGAYPVIGYLATGVVYAGYDASDSNNFKVSIGGAGAIKVLGASLSKGLGDTLYLTAWGDNGELIYRVHDMADLSLLGSYSLGACTESELNAKTYFAMPLAAFGDDLFCWFYGRFNPAGLGESHIIYTADSGLSLVAFEQGWGSAYCGSLIDDFGLVFGARCAGSQTKLYTGQWNSSLELKSTLLFSAAINPFSMVYNFLDDSVYAAAAAGNSKMVIKANSPFTSWTDITYNHSTAAGVKAIVAL